MISSFFGKTKPINFIILIIILSVSYWEFTIFNGLTTYNTDSLLVDFAAFIVLIFTLFGIDFIVKRNKIIRGNSYLMLFFTFFLLLFPATILASDIIFANFFLILASRRLLSLKGLKEVKLKIFDASLWIVIASLFYEWMLLFLIVVFMAIFIYTRKNIKTWCIPFVALVAGFFISSCFLLVANGDLTYFETHYQFAINLDGYTSLFNFAFIWFSLIGLIATITYFIKSKNISNDRISMLWIIIIQINITVLLVLNSGEKGTILLAFFPIGIMLSLFLETIKKFVIKEVLFFVLILVPLVLLLL